MYFLMEMMLKIIVQKSQEGDIENYEVKRNVWQAMRNPLHGVSVTRVGLVIRLLG